MANFLTACVPIITVGLREPIEFYVIKFVLFDFFAESLACFELDDF